MSPQSQVCNRLLAGANGIRTLGPRKPLSPDCTLRTALAWSPRPRATLHALNELAPALLREKEKGKFRHLGISETAPHDPEHRMVTRACRDGVWEVAMVGFRMMHQNAHHGLVGGNATRPTTGPQTATPKRIRR